MGSLSLRHLLFPSFFRFLLGLRRLEDVLDGRGQREVGQGGDLGQLGRLLRLDELKHRKLLRELISRFAQKFQILVKMSSVKVQSLKLYA